MTVYDTLELQCWSLRKNTCKEITDLLMNILTLQSVIKKSTSQCLAHQDILWLVKLIGLPCLQKNTLWRRTQKLWPSREDRLRPWVVEGWQIRRPLVGTSWSTSATYAMNEGHPHAELWVRIDAGAAATFWSARAIWREREVGMPECQVLWKKFLWHTS
jgi:hypothetical protein